MSARLKPAGLARVGLDARAGPWYSAVEQTFAGREKGNQPSHQAWPEGYRAMRQHEHLQADECCPKDLGTWTFDYESERIGSSYVIHADCFDWLSRVPADSIHAIVTDPPFGVKEYDFDQLEKMKNGTGGVWRIPPCFDGHQRSPLPRFTAFNGSELARLQRFFTEWARLAARVLRPGGHVLIASAPVLAQLVFSALVEGGLEFRGQVVRLVRTLRGGNRPKNAEDEFSGVCSMPRGCYEPWGLFRKPMGELRVSDCLRKYQTGALRRAPDGTPFCDVIESERTPREERDIAHHPTLKPQSLMRVLVYAALPLGEGIVLDPFMGSGSTIAAAEAVDARSIGIERHGEYFQISKRAIPALAALNAPMSAQPQGRLQL